MDYMGGFLFCAPNFDRARLIDLTVQAMDLHHGNMHIDYDFVMNNLPESSELLAKPTLEGLAKVKTGKIDFGPEVYTFGPDPYYEPDESSALLDLYSTVELNVYEGAFRQHGSNT